MHHDMKLNEDKLYLTSGKNKNQLVMEPILDSKILPPLKHKPKKYYNVIKDTK